MATTRNVLLMSDFSCKDKYCFGSPAKVLTKKTYHVADQSGANHNNAATAPLDTSIPATDGTVIGTLDGTNTTPIIANGGVVKEIFDDCVIEWMATYGGDCTTLTWAQVNMDLSDVNPAGVPLDCSLLSI